MWGRLFKKDELECEWKLREGEEKENCMHNTWLPQQCFHSTDSDRQMPVICYPIFGPKVQTYHMALSVSVKNITKNKLNISLYYVAVYSWKEKTFIDRMCTRILEFWAGPKTIEFICTIKNELLSRQKNFLSGKLLCCSRRQDFWCISRTLFATVAYLDKYEDRQKTNMTNVGQYEMYDIFLVANPSQTYSIILSIYFHGAVILAHFRYLNLIFHIESM